MDQIKSLFLLIARSLIDAPDQVKVNVLEGDRTIVFELAVGNNDVGKVIGRQGKTANALRTIIAAAGNKVKKRCVLEVIE